MLVFGINAVGKSTLMKAVGCAVVMAQAGMYVPAEAFALRPFDGVYTRIGGSDNLFAGTSSFGAEVAELRSALRRATRDSLVLGDELAHTTEHVSAISLVGQGIATLAQRGCCFMLTSHLHEVTDVACVRELIDAKRVRVRHLHVEAEPDGTMVYARGLREGQGNPCYGLEVAGALGMGDAFMQGAHRIRKALLGVPTHLVAPRASRYNARVFVDACALCGKRADATHHVREQASADDDGFVDGHRVNAAFNLVAVCDACHARLHKDPHAPPARTAKTTRGRRIVSSDQTP